ncbi:hypothetical protein BS50DRAFT_503557 [Corynespora cassiicola Philippines]|uniref:Zn(2)-C6 fungal-type domain-containing protein n=1 Tax=Corynespora cassiicola Philippines TaxID=1448308 RepID=A0A2T2N948_CORCC|nr:hypothetical protein BS50DRAFT_503557 [Corynespora cassiicola Philippines]
MSPGPASIQKRHSKKSAFSCETCRKRKVKCDAEHPVCKRCRNRSDTCVYRLSPTLSYTQRLEQEVEHLKRELLVAQGATRYNQTGIDSASSISEFMDTSQPPLSSVDETIEMEKDAQLSLHGTATLFQLPTTTNVRGDKQVRAYEELSAEKENLMNNAWRERAYEKLAELPEPYRSLLDSHFCWIQPLFNFVYRPAFTRDMKTDGPYFSQALLNTILSHSIRWCRDEPGMNQLLAPFNGGASFSEDAVRYVFSDVQNGDKKVPTVQALLLLSAQECGRGNRTQAWLYSGMAFRLIDDMGICVDCSRYGEAEKLSTEEIEIRNRLFWSCYFWDKLISLYFGRSPVIQSSKISPPRVLMDDTAEIEAWTPHGALSSPYAPKQAHSISCFIQMCMLAEILNQILIHHYNPSQEITPQLAYRHAVEEGSKLRDWWRHLPNHLKINLAALQRECPPSHIVTLNCLYHAINILLNRAMLKLGREPQLAGAIATQNPLIQCISSATSITALFDLYNRTFGEGHVVLALAYSVYVAASIFLLEIQATGHAATSSLERLFFCLKTLERLKKTNPVIAIASNLITKELEALGVPSMDEIIPDEASRASQTLHQRPLVPLPVGTYSASSPTDIHQNNSLNQQMDPILLDLSYFGGELDIDSSYSLLDMPSEIYDTFTQTDPISITMNPGFDIF